MEINKAFFVGMDGGADTVSLGVSLAESYKGGEAAIGMTIDIMLASCFANAKNKDEFLCHVRYAIAQLQIVERNASRDE